MYSDELGRIPVHGVYNFGGPLPQTMGGHAHMATGIPRQQQQHQTSQMPSGSWYANPADPLGTMGTQASAHAQAQAHAQAYSMPSTAGMSYDPSMFAAPQAGTSASMGAGGGYAGQAATSAATLMDNEAMALWSAAPTGFE
jgi:hypothetical protein